MFSFDLIKHLIKQYWFHEINIRILGAKKSGGGAFLQNQHCTIFSSVFCLMFLIGAIKPIVEKKFITFFLGNCLGEVT